MKDTLSCLKIIQKFTYLEKHGNKELALLPQSYLNTDIYKVSREIKKMQKLSSNFLTAWYEVGSADKRIESKSNKKR